MPIQVLWLHGRAPQAAPVNGQLYSNISDQTRNVIPDAVTSGTSRKLHRASDEIPYHGACPLPLGNQEVSHFKTTGLYLGYQLRRF